MALAPEATPLEDPDTGKKDLHCGFFKMKIFMYLAKDSVESVVEESVGPESVLFGIKTLLT